MNYGFIAFCLLLVFDLGVAVAKHGEPQDDYHAGKSLLGAAIMFAILLWAMHWKVG